MRPFSIITPSLASLRPVFLQKNLMAQVSKSLISLGCPKIHAAPGLRPGDLVNDSKNG